MFLADKENHMKNLTFNFTESEVARIIELLELAIPDYKIIVEDHTIDKQIRSHYLELAKESNKLFVKIGKQVELAKWDIERFNIESWDCKDIL